MGCVTFFLKVQKPCTFNFYDIFRQNKRKGCDKREKEYAPKRAPGSTSKSIMRRRQDTVENLATEFDVSVRTIKYDIEELTLTHPIETIRGRYGGGVKVADGYYIGRRYLKPSQRELLLRLQDGLSEKDAEIMNSILEDFTL